MTKTLRELVRRAEALPEAAQKELVHLAEEIERELRTGTYHTTADELAAIDEADRSGVATEAEVEAAFAKFRNG